MVMVKKIFIILTILLITTQSLALNPASFEIKVTVNKPPEGVRLVKPNDGFVITEGDTLTISIDANDSNLDTLKYRFYINGSIKRDWATESSYSYTLTEDDIGLNKIRAEVTDSIDDPVPTGEAEIYVFRKSLDLPIVQ